MILLAAICNIVFYLYYTSRLSVYMSKYIYLLSLYLCIGAQMIMTDVSGTRGLCSIISMSIYSILHHIVSDPMSF